MDLIESESEESNEIYIGKKVKKENFPILEDSDISDQDQDISEDSFQAPKIK